MYVIIDHNNKIHAIATRKEDAVAIKKSGNLDNIKYKIVEVDDEFKKR